MKWLRPSYLANMVCAGMLLMAGALLLPTAENQQQRQPFHVPAAVSEVAPPPAPVDCSAMPCIALTFDDGPHPHHTFRVLDILAEKKVTATFFVLGVHAAAHPDIMQRIHKAGHEIGNHSWNHANLTTLSPAEIDQQVLSTQSAITAAGVPAPRWFRPPYGAMNAQVRAHVPLGLALWNVDPEDWGKHDPNAIIDHVTAHAGPGRIVDLHDPHSTTADALPAIIDRLRPHYQLVTISQLFNTVPGQRGEFYGR